MSVHSCQSASVSLAHYFGRDCVVYVVVVSALFHIIISHIVLERLRGERSRYAQRTIGAFPAFLANRRLCAAVCIVHFPELRSITYSAFQRLCCLAELTYHVTSLGIYGERTSVLTFAFPTMFPVIYP